MIKKALTRERLDEEFKKWLHVDDRIEFWYQGITSYICDAKVLDFGCLKDEKNEDILCFEEDQTIVFNVEN